MIVIVCYVMSVLNIYKERVSSAHTRQVEYEILLFFFFSNYLDAKEVFISKTVCLTLTLTLTLVSRHSTWWNVVRRVVAWRYSGAVWGSQRTCVCVQVILRITNVTWIVDVIVVKYEGLFSNVYYLKFIIFVSSIFVKVLSITPANLFWHFVNLSIQHVPEVCLD